MLFRSHEGVLKRAVGGGGIFMTEYESEGSPGVVAFATKLPGEILPVRIEPGHELMVHRHGFLCASEGKLTMAFQKKLGPGSSAARDSSRRRWAVRPTRGSRSMAR